MIRYLVKRLLLFVPTLFVVSLLAFYISVKAPGDPVEILSQTANAQGTNAAYTASQQYKDSVRVQLGLHLPLFYFSLGTSNDCDTLHRVMNRQERYALYRLTRKYGQWPMVSDYYQTLKKLPAQMARIKPDSIDAAYTYLKDTHTLVLYEPPKGIIRLKKRQRILVDSTLIHPYPAGMVQDEANLLLNTALTLPIIFSPEVIKAKTDSLKQITRSKPYLQFLLPHIANIEKKFTALQQHSGTGGNFIPHLAWHGSQNQYHHWMTELFKGNFGYSYIDQRPIAEKIWPRFVRSFTLVLLSVLFAYLVSVPLGVYSAQKQGSLFDRLVSVLVFILYAVPLFFAGTALLYLFANPEYLSWFPESGYCDPEHYDHNWSLAQKIYHTFPYMVLPLITYTYTSFAFISRVIRSATLQELGQDYIRTARAKGLSSPQVLWRHAVRNALLPVITTFVNIFPAAIAGSIVVETIFSYDGMGIAAYESVTSRDYPMLVCIFTLAGFMSMIAYFIADVLYALVDPRIRYHSK